MPPAAQLTSCSTPGRMNNTSPATCSPPLMTDTDPRLPAITQGAGLQWAARFPTSTENTDAGSSRAARDIEKTIVGTLIQRNGRSQVVHLDVMEQPAISSRNKENYLNAKEAFNRRDLTSCMS